MVQQMAASDPAMREIIRSSEALEVLLSEESMEELFQQSCKQTGCQ